MTQEQLEEFARARVGTTLKDKWSLDGLLGVGGTASVYSARHKNGKRVALKVLHPELSAHEHFRERFLREAYVGNRIEHPGAITVYDNDVTDDGCAFLVMDLLEGENLEIRRERKGGTLEPLEVLSLMDAVLDTLQAAHDKGVVHRDIKPENLFLTTENTVRLLDFGIAHINVPQSPGQTLAGVSMGTPAFMPPEQASAHWDKVDAQSDIWAVGASMFTLLTGRYVHQGSTVNESLVLAVTKSAPRVEQINPKLPKPICTIVNKALERDKSRRYQSASEMQLHVRQVFHQLQGDVPEEERYSLSDGLVAKHSLPPRALNVEWPEADASADGHSPLPHGIVDPIAAAAFAADRITLDDTGTNTDVHRKRFKASPDKRWVLGGTAALIVIVLGIFLSSGKDEPSGVRAAEDKQARAAKPEPPVADPQPPAAESAPAPVEPEVPPAAASVEEDGTEASEERAAGGNLAPRRVIGRPVGARPGAGAGKAAPGGEARTDEEFDPFAERE